MRRTAIILIALCFPGFVARAATDTLYTVQLGNSGNEWGWCVQQTTDHGFVVCGSNGSYTAPGYLVKTDAGGYEQWYQAFGRPNTTGKCVCQLEDGGYAIVGTTQIGAPYRMFLARFSANGALIFYRPYIIPGSEQDYGYGVLPTADGGFMVLGIIFPTGSDGYDVILMKTDGLGNILWTRTYGGNSHEDGQSLAPTSDGGYVIAGRKYMGPYNTDFYLIKVEDDGDTVWTRTFGGPVDDEANCVIQTQDGGYALFGTSDPTPGNSNMLLVKTDDQGYPQWSQIYGGAGNESGWGVIQQLDGGYVLAGTTDSYGAWSRNVYVLRTDAQGDTLWTQAYGGDGDDRGHSICSTIGGGFAVTGIISTAGSWPTFDAWLLRFESETLTISLQPHSSPIVIPPGGGSFLYDIQISDQEDTSWAVDVWIDMTSPTGISFPILFRSNIVLASGQILERDSLMQWVPATAEPGTYQVEAWLSDHNTWEILNRDSFTFTKQSGAAFLNHDFGWALWGWGEDGTPPSETLPGRFTLYSPCPNPFNPITAISYQLSANSHVRLEVFDTAGRLVTTLVNGWRLAGSHQVTWDASGLPSGLYFCRMQAGDFTGMQKLLLVK